MTQSSESGAAREEQGALPCSCCHDEDAPPAPSPDVAALVEALLREANTPLPITGEITRQLAPILTPLQGLMREAAEALAAQARRTEEAERRLAQMVAVAAEHYGDAEQLQQRLAAVEAKLAEAAEDPANATGGFDAAMGLADAEQERAKAAEQRVAALTKELAEMRRQRAMEALRTGENV